MLLSQVYGPVSLSKEAYSGTYGLDFDTAYFDSVVGITILDETNSDTTILDTELSMASQGTYQPLRSFCSSVYCTVNNHRCAVYLRQ